MSKVDHPPHYNAHPSGIEAIDLCERIGFNLGNAVKYLMRADHKGQRHEDLEKARWYLLRQLDLCPSISISPAAAALAKRIHDSEPETPLGWLTGALARGVVVRRDLKRTASKIGCEL